MAPCGNQRAARIGVLLIERDLLTATRYSRDAGTLSRKQLSPRGTRRCVRRQERHSEGCQVRMERWRIRSAQPAGKSVSVRLHVHKNSGFRVSNWSRLCGRFPVFSLIVCHLFCPAPDLKLDINPQGKKSGYEHVTNSIFPWSKFVSRLHQLRTAAPLMSFGPRRVTVGVGEEGLHVPSSFPRQNRFHLLLFGN